jgi:hypothetical protein
MVSTKLDAMNYAINVLRRELDSIQNKPMEYEGRDWRYQDTIDCRNALDFIKR